MRDIISLLKYEASRRPDLKAILDRNFDESDIDAYNAPLPWFKSAMRKYMEREKTRALVIDVSQLPIVDGVVPDFDGWVSEWPGDDTFIQVSGVSSILVKRGDLLWKDPHGSYWIDTVKCKTTPREFVSLPETKCTKTRYQEMVRDRLIAKYGPPTEVNPSFVIRRLPA